MNLEELLKLSSFQSWLDKQDPSACIGLPNTQDSCPVALYLREQTGQTYYVKKGEIRKPERMSDNGEFVCGLPPWMKAFTNYIDAHIRFPNEVRVQQAQAIIDDMLRQLQETI